MCTFLTYSIKQICVRTETYNTKFKPYLGIVFKVIVDKIASITKETVLNKPAFANLGKSRRWVYTNHWRIIIDVTVEIEAGRSTTA